MDVIQEANESSIQSNSISLQNPMFNGQGQSNRILLDSKSIQNNDGILFPIRQEVPSSNGSLDSDQDAKSDSISGSKSESLDQPDCDSDEDEYVEGILA